MVSSFQMSNSRFAPTSLLGPSSSSINSSDPLTPPPTAPGSPVDSFPFSPLLADQFPSQQLPRPTTPTTKLKAKKSELVPPIRAIRKKKSRATLPVEQGSKSEETLPARFDAPYSPVFPRVQFPTILSSDEEGTEGGERDWNRFGFTSPSKSGAKGSRGEEKSPGVSRTYSTTTKRTEHRSWTYSTSSIRAEEIARAAAEPSPRHDRQRSSSHNPVEPIPSSRTVPFPTSPSATRRTANSTSHRHLRDHKSTSNLKDDSDYSRRGTKSFNAERSFQRIFDPPISPYVDPLEGYHIPSASNRSSYHSAVPSSFIPASNEPPFLQPIVNTFLLLLFSTIAACSISAVLFASFTLTAYDDLGRRVAGVKDRWGRVQGSIEGARSGVGKMIEGAVGALGIVSWATGSGKGLRRSFDIRRKGWSNSNGFSDPTKSRWRNFGRNVGTGANSPRKRTMSPAATRRSTSAHSNVSSSRLNPSNSSSTPITTPYDTEPPVDITAGAWHSDPESEEDPFVVPHSTPRDSRTPSTFVSEDEYFDEVPASGTNRGRKDSDTSNRSLPPRPPLLILIPSIFALIFLTLWNLITKFLKSKRN